MIKSEVECTPARILPVVFVDMSLRMGRRGAEHIDDATVGPHQASHEDEMSTDVRRQFEERHIAFSNAYFDIVELKERAVVSIAFLDFARCSTPAGKRMHMLWDSQRRFQVLPYMIDNGPMCLQICIPAPTPQDQKQSVTWDWGGVGGGITERP